MELLALRALGPPHWTEENELMFRGQLGVNIDGLDAQSLATILDSLQGHIIAGHPRDESVLEDRRSKAQAALATLMEGKGLSFKSSLGGEDEAQAVAVKH
jgi:hypothetical protein|eukprot:COSAG06_NODE_215_length_20124_cov_3.931735_19_plen_100_part_00